MLFVENKEFVNQDYRLKSLPRKEYDNCSFRNCSFAGSNLSEYVFSDCLFDNCDLSNCLLHNTAFKDVKFTNSKLLGLHFEDCNPFLLEFLFQNTVLNYASFYKLKIKKTKFISCSLSDVDFIEADLTGSNFDNCDMSGAQFERTVLEKCDFYSSFNYVIDPSINKIKKAKFSVQGAIGLLANYDIDIVP